MNAINKFPKSQTHIIREYEHFYCNNEIDEDQRHHYLDKKSFESLENFVRSQGQLESESENSERFMHLSYKQKWGKQ